MNKGLKFTATLLLITMLIGSLSGCGSASKDVTETTVQTEVAEDEAKAAGQEEAAARAAEEAAAKEAEANEYYEKGRTFLYGLDGNKINLESAYTNFEKAREMGKQDASFYLGLLCYDYNYPNHDYAKAKSYFEEAEDNQYAQIKLGDIYYLGDGVEADKKKAKELFQSAIDRGCVEGYMSMGYVAYDEKDYTTAFEYFNKATEGTEQTFTADAMDWIGYFYKEGYEVEQDYTKAMEWYEKSADLGNVNAMDWIGYFYKEGYEVEQDYTKALEWYEKAAELGDTWAMNEIGWLYGNGKGVEQDYNKALEWYEKAAALGDETAMENAEHIRKLMK